MLCMRVRTAQGQAVGGAWPAAVCVCTSRCQAVRGARPAAVCVHGSGARGKQCLHSPCSRARNPGTHLRKVLIKSCHRAPWNMHACVCAGLPEPCTQIFRDFNLAVRAGTTVALVGSSGSGKVSLRVRPRHFGTGGIYLAIGGTAATLGGAHAHRAGAHVWLECVAGGRLPGAAANVCSSNMPSAPATSALPRLPAAHYFDRAWHKTHALPHMPRTGMDVGVAGSV